MIEIKQELVIDRKKVADAIHKVIGVGIELLGMNKYGPHEHGKMKLIRTLGPHINSGVAMIQQETAMVRAAIVVERMKQLGYSSESERIEK